MGAAAQAGIVGDGARGLKTQAPETIEAQQKPMSKRQEFQTKWKAEQDAKDEEEFR